MSREADHPPKDIASGFYDEKNRGYFGSPRLDLLEILPECSSGRGLRVLELGAGDGATLREAKRRGLAAYTAGIELFAAPAASPDPDAPDLFFTGNIETMELDLPAASFDAVLCADVLEHLVDPWRALTRLVGLLEPGGVVLSSIPNIRNHRALAEIVLRGDFRYAEAGLLDRSHLRFFCRRNIVALHEAAGLVVERVAENMGGFGRHHRLLDRLTFGRLHEFFVFQYLTVARKPETARS